MDICIRDGKIVDGVSKSAEVVDASGKIVMAEGVEPHTHIILIKESSSFNTVGYRYGIVHSN